MNEVGFGVTVNGRPKGIWPLPFSRAKETAERYQREALKQAVPSIVAVVPVFAGAPIEIAPPAKHKDTA